MSNPPACHIRTVRLRAPDEGLVRRGAVLLEDALRTATLPALGSRLLLVRSLQVGRIDPRAGPASVALAVEARLRALGTLAVRATDPGAAQAPAVYFADPVEPYILLALALARGLPPAGWFWPAAVPEWQPGLPPAAALRRVLYGALARDTGPPAALLLIQELHRAGLVDSLLAALDPPDGPALLRAFGWRAAGLAAPGRAATPAEPSAGPWQVTLARWATTWGRADARAVWLAGIALAADKPARLLDPALSTRAQRLLAGLAPGAPAAGPAARRPVPPPALPAWRTEPSPGGPLAPPRAAAPPATRSLALPILSLAAGPAPAPAARGAGERVAPAAPKSTGQVDLPAALRGLPFVAAPEAAPQPHGETAGHGRPTHFAGLFFVLPALARLGLPAMLAAAPHLIERDLAGHILADLAAYLGVPATDPVRAALPPLDAGEPAPCPFVAPGAWRAGLAGRGPLTVRRLAGSGGARLLTDRSGRLVLALWRGRAPTPVHALATGVAVAAGPDRAAAADLALLVGAWRTALRRWCRRYAGLGLHDLVARPGRIALTRSHLDLFLDFRAADVRVRRAGLDLDPGWVPWLGRVVSFHYLDGVPDDGR